MLKTLVSYFCIFLSITVASHAQARGALLQETREIYFVDSEFSLDHIERAIKAALNDRKWQIESEKLDQPRNIIASLYVRSHKITIKLAYDKEKLVLSYQDSVNMSYKEKNGNKYIHNNYHKWTETLLDYFRGYVGLNDPYHFRDDPYPGRVHPHHGPRIFGPGHRPRPF